MFVRCTAPNCSCKTLWSMADVWVCDECGEFLPHKTYLETLAKAQESYRVLTRFLNGDGMADFVVLNAWKALKAAPFQSLAVIMFVDSREDAEAMRDQLGRQLATKLKMV